MRTLALALALLAPFQSVDDAVRAVVQAHRTPTGTRIFQTISDVGRPVTVVGALAAIAVLDRTAGPITALRALLTLIPTNLGVEALKRLTFRARPDGEHKRSNAAFPSSHAANAAAIAIVFARRWRRLTPAFALFALAVAASRIYLDRHWLSDVVVGIAFGALAAWLVIRFGPRPRGPAAGAAGSPPPGTGPVA